MRCFISLDIPLKVKNYIKKIQLKLSNFRGKITEKNNLHLTLKFLGEIDSKKLIEVKSVLEKIKFKKIHANIDSIGVFDSNIIKIVWIKINGIDELQKIIDESLKDFFSFEKRFMSHLTIARVKSIKNKREFLNKLSSIPIEKIRFSVDKFVLKESFLKRDGSVYKDLGVYFLAD